MSQPATTERAARDYVLSKQSDLNHPHAFPLVQSAPTTHYRPRHGCCTIGIKSV
jgi:predicted Abi (CAAX) family protease